MSPFVGRQRVSSCGSPSASSRVIENPRGLLKRYVLGERERPVSLRVMTGRPDQGSSSCEVTCCLGSEPAWPVTDQLEGTQLSLQEDLHTWVWSHTSRGPETASRLYFNTYGTGRAETLVSFAVGETCFPPPSSSSSADTAGLGLVVRVQLTARLEGGLLPPRCSSIRLLL